MTKTDPEIAELAARLFYEHGIAATGVDALSKAAGISKRTLYERFGSKAALIEAALATLDEPGCERFTAAAERAATTPRGQLEQLFVAVEQAAGSPDFRGCPFANASAELANPEHPAHEVIRRHKERWRRWILVRTKAIGARDPALLSRQLLLILDGTQAQALVQRSSRPARDAQKLVRTLIDSAIDVAHQ
jgi:AcrR family transcriptional regulator